MDVDDAFFTLNLFDYQPGLTAILNVRGIIAPGTYQNYLQYEFESANGLVVAHNVYC